MDAYLTKDYQTMKVSRDKEGIVLVQFNRPEALNAADIKMSYERLEIFSSVSDDPKAKVLIITGNDKAYCAGGDLEAFSKFNTTDAMTFSARGLAYQKVLMDMPKPTIAAVAGYAFGGGFENVLLCDLRIAAENALFALPEINVGIFPGGGGTQRLVQHISPAQAKEMIFFGTRIDGQRALDLGLINKVVPLDDLLEEAYIWARKLTEKAPLALKQAKAAINNAWGTTIEVGMDYEVTSWSSLFGTVDQKEGMQAFLEKRKPDFSGE